MITEQCKDKVYFSDVLTFDYKELYKELTQILDANNINHGLIKNTNDYWCRDFMPIQWGNDMYTQFVYRPDYLKNKDEYRTDSKDVWGKLGLKTSCYNESLLNIDGGNIVCCKGGESHWGRESTYLVMTDKVMVENPQYTKDKIEAMIKE